MIVAAPIFRFLATHAAPWIACFLLGAVFHAERVAKAEIAALELEKDKAITALEAVSERLVARELDQAINETARLEDLEELRNVFFDNAPRAEAGTCILDDGERERVRIKAAAVNRHIASVVSRRSGLSGSEENDSGPGALAGDQ